MQKIPEVYLSTAYLGNVEYFSKLVSAEKVFIEQYEHYQKQSYRNRCCIMAANGMLSLTIPIEKMHGVKMSIRDVRIDYQRKWQQNHWRALISAYSSAPFFEYYADDILPFYTKKEPFLFDFNYRLTELMLDLIHQPSSICLTENYYSGSSQFDYRQRIHPKVQSAEQDVVFLPKPYFQVFAVRYGFIPNLSIVDLLFNEGPNALSILL